MADNPPESLTKNGKTKNSTVLDIWKHQFVDAITVTIFNITNVLDSSISPFGLLIITKISFFTCVFLPILNQTVGNISIKESG